MAYKVLGQTLATAASSSVLVNLIKDPSFEGLTRSWSLVSSSGSNSNQAWYQVTGTQWWTQAQDTTYGGIYQMGDWTTATSSNISNGINPPYGTKAIGIGNTGTSNTYSSSLMKLAYGLSTATASSDTFNTARFGGISRAIPVTAGVTYYYGLDMMANQISTSYYRILWFDASGTYLSNTSNDISANITYSSTAWTRGNFSVTAPTNAAWAGIQLEFAPYLNGTMQIAIDGIHFGPVSGATFPNPTTGGTNSTLTAPFTSRFSATWSGTINNSTTIQNYAGAAVDLYTVPAASSAVISTVVVSNPNTSAATFRIAVVPSGETLALKNWVAFDIPLTANTTQTITIGMTLATGDKIKVSSDSNLVSFTAFGSEN